MSQTTTIDSEEGHAWHPMGPREKSIRMYGKGFSQAPKIPSCLGNCAPPVFQGVLHPGEECKTSNPMNYNKNMISAWPYKITLLLKSGGPC